MHKHISNLNNSFRHDVYFDKTGHNKNWIYRLVSSAVDFQ